MSFRENIVSFLQSKEINGITDDLAEQLIIAATGGPAEKALAIKNTIKDITHLPTYIFWYKMERFLRGTFYSMEDQVKMARKFDPNTDEYARYVEDLIQFVDQIENIEKVDYYAALTRAFLLTEMEKRLYYKLSKFLLLCTRDELEYVRIVPYDFHSENTAEISALYQFGLFTQSEDTDETNTVYVLSDFAKALKQNCLNFEEGVGIEKRLVSYDSLKPLNNPEKVNAITPEEIDKLWDNAIYATDDNNDGNVVIHTGA